MEWEENEPCKFRMQFEESRDELMEQYQRLCASVNHYSGDKQGLKYQTMTSQQRGMVKDINTYTKNIKDLKEIDGDEETRIALDKEFEEQSKVVDKFFKTLEESAPEEVKEEIKEMDKEDIIISELGNEYNVDTSATNSDEKQAVDDLLKELGF